MYATFTMINLGPGMRQEAEKIANQFAPVNRSLKGFIRYNYFGDVETGDYGSLILYESKEDAENALATIGPEMKKTAGDIVKGEPIRRVFEIYEPTS